MFAHAPLSKNNMRRSEPTAKKKFGQNLNKLVKPAAPPIVASGAGRDARNGLLLLSTKTNKTLKEGPGLLSAKTGTSASTAEKTSTTTATPTSPTAVPTPPSSASKPAYADARAASTHDVLLSAVTGASLEPTAPRDAWGVQQQQQQQQQAKEESAVVVVKEPEEKPRETSAEQKEHQHQHQNDNININNNNNNMPAWDEYGGRETLQAKEEKVLFVASSKTQPSSSIQSSSSPQAPKIGAVEAKTNHNKNHAAVPPRRLWEPEDTAASKEVSTTNTTTVSADVPIKIKATNVKPSTTNTTTATTSSTKPSSSAAATSTTATLSNAPVFHVASYDDRDRGETKPPATRMLYDPKSGSMVAANTQLKNSRNTSHNNNSNNHTNSSSTTPKRASSRREKTDKVQGGGNTRNGLQEVTIKVGSKRREDGPTSLDNGGSGKNQPDSVKTSTKQQQQQQKLSLSHHNTQRQLPRTCGVLYARDKDGNLVCADGCDGDLGYGMHCVPGGRLHNNKAYMKYTQQQQTQNLQHNNDDDDENMYSNDDDYKLNGIHGGRYTSYGKNQAPLFSKFGGDDQDAYVLPEPLEYVRANDKLELVTGMEDDTPTLKPTAREWAPSRAALAATARSLEGEEDDNDDDGPLGLGFDPTQDMNFVIESPSHEQRATSRLESLGLGALALEPSDNSAGPRHLFGFGSTNTWGANPDAGSMVNTSDWKIPNTSNLFGAGVFGMLDEDTVRDTATPSYLNIPGSSAWSTSALESLTSNGDVSKTTAGD